MAIDPTVVRAVGALLEERRARAKRERNLERYYDGTVVIPQAVVRARLTNAYKLLMPMASAPWGSLVVDAIQDRLEVNGLRPGSAEGQKEVADRLWASWQDNDLDAESKLAQNKSLLAGRSFATVWPADDGSGPEIVYDGPGQVVVRYREGRRHPRFAELALRHWVEEDDTTCITLYTRDEVLKFKTAKRDRRGADAFQVQGEWWIPREGRDDPWESENPYGRVPVIELGVNRRLRGGTFPYARGEFEHCLGLLDRVNLLTFLGLVVALWMGFPLRGVIGDRIRRQVLRDDTGETIPDPDNEDRPKTRRLPPFDAEADTMFQLENPNARIEEFKAADRKNLSIFAELDQLAVVTKTPRHYFPLEGGMSNIAADTIRANEGALHGKAKGHKASLGGGHTDTLRLAGLMLEPELRLAPDAAVTWADLESRSMAERADAALKISQIKGVPWQFVAERFLGLTQDEMTRIESLQSRNPLRMLLEQTQMPPGAGAPEEPEEQPEPAGANGSGG